MTGTRNPPLSGQGSNVTYRLVEALGQSIVGGGHGPDRPFPTEAELARKYGASRSVTREAVKMLTAKGLLSARPRSGTAVRRESAWNLFDPDVLRWLLERKVELELLREFTEVRLAIEPAAAGLAARRATAEGLAGIQAGVERMKAAERGADDPLAADVAFHVAVLDAAGNRFYAQLRELVNTALHISIRVTNAQKGVRQGSVPAHERVAQAILRRDADAASAAMTAILTEVMNLIERAGRGRGPARLDLDGTY